MRTGNRANQFIDAAAAYERPLYLTCLSMLRNRDDAEDALQETMLKAFRAYRDFRGDAQLYSWLRKIAVNVCIDMTRKRKNVVSIDEMTEEGGEVQDTAVGPYEKLEKAERMRILGLAIEELKPDARTLIILRDVQGLSYEEISDALEVPIGTVKSGLSRARNSLQKRLTVHAELFGKANPDERRKA